MLTLRIPPEKTQPLRAELAMQYEPQPCTDAQNGSDESLQSN